MTGGPYVSGVGMGKYGNYVNHNAWCEIHQKKAFTKDRAKAAIRNMHESGMRRYRCEHMEGMWHVGHLAQVIRDGEMTVADVYGLYLDRRALARDPLGNRPW